MSKEQMMGGFDELATDRRITRAGRSTPHGLRGIFLQISQLKLELIQQRAAFRGLPEPLVPQLPDR